MDRHRRMDRTLICLVVSMTLGALVLQWIQPGREQGRAYARDLIAGMSHPWQAIHLDPVRATLEESIRVSHFVIAPDGQAHATSNWDAQTAIGAEPTIRIILVTPSYSHEITPAQTDSARLLIEALLKKGLISPDRVVWDDTLNVRAPGTSSGDSRAAAGNAAHPR